MKSQSHSWQQNGSIMLWRYPDNERNFPGWHLTADAGGCASVVAVLDAFAADGAPASRTLSITAPTAAVLAVPNNGSACAKAPRKLRLSFSEDTALWSFPDSDAPAELSFGAEWLPILRQAFLGIPSGKGDYSIGSAERGRLWLWWQPAGG